MANYKPSSYDEITAMGLTRRFPSQYKFQMLYFYFPGTQTKSLKLAGTQLQYRTPANTQIRLVYARHTSKSAAVNTINLGVSATVDTLDTTLWAVETNSEIQPTPYDDFPIDVILTSTEDDYIANSSGTQGALYVIIFEEPI